MSRRKKPDVPLRGHGGSVEDAVNDAINEQCRANRPSMRNARLSRDVARKAFRDLRRALDEIRELEAQPEARFEALAAKCAEDLTTEEIEEFGALKEKLDKKREPGESKRAWEERRRHEQRAQLLNRCVPMRKCPICGATRTKSRSWVVVDKAKLRGVLSRVATGGVTLQDIGKLKRAGVCCLACWRLRFTHSPNEKMVVGKERGI